MGYGAWSASSWDNYKSKRSISDTSTVKEIYTSRSLKDQYNPRKIKMRESCDSEEHPNSTPIILGLDVTGSMGYLSEEIAKNALNTLILNIYNNAIVNDPQVMVMAIGDCFSDSSPLQVTQFESDIRVAEQMTSLYFEGAGGGNGGESYLAAWYFASRHTSIDSYTKHGKKGFLITIGDEPTHKILTKEQIKEFFGDDVEDDLTAEDLFKEVSEKYNVFHICVGSYGYHGSDKKWKALIGERAYVLNDHRKLPEMIAGILKVASQEEDFVDYNENLESNNDEGLVEL